MKIKEGGGMGIQKDKDFTSLPEIAKLYQACKERDLTIAEREYLKGARDAWQAAKAQAVPAGFVLIKASDREQEMLELIDQRDYMESQADELKDKLQALYGVDFGEHSSCNFPFQNAIDYDDSDFVLVKKNHLSEVVEKIERMFEEDSLLALGELLPIQQGIKAMIEAQEQK